MSAPAAEGRHAAPMSFPARLAYEAGNLAYDLVQFAARRTPGMVFAMLLPCALVVQAIGMRGGV